MTHLFLRQPVVALPAGRSFWLQDIRAERITPALAGENHTDVAIVGGGFTGLWTALRIRELAPETRITILEADFCGSGASGRNGGQVHSWFAEIDQIAAVTGVEEAAQLCRETADVIAELALLQAQGVIDMDLRLDGWLWTASSKAQEGAWDRAAAMCQSIGVDCFEPLSAGDISRRTGSSVSYAGITEAKAGSIHPAKLAHGLRQFALSRGITIHEGSPVLKISPGMRCVLHTAGGSLGASKVVLAANAWLSALAELRRHLYVVSSEVIATPEVPDQLHQIGWRDGAAICDSQHHVLYYQRTKPGRIIFGRGGGRIAFAGDFGAAFNRDPDRGRQNLRELHRVYPELQNVPVAYDWSGPIDCVAEHVPVFGHLRGHPNIFYGMGFNGTGIAQTPIGGRILASLVLERKDRWTESGLVGLERRMSLPREPIRYLGARLVRRAISHINAAEVQNRDPGQLARWIARYKPGKH